MLRIPLPMAGDRDIAQLLAELGFGTPEDCARARAHLESLHLTRPGKRRVSDEKRPAIEAALSSRFAVLCASPDCIRTAMRGREHVLAIPSTRCAHCGGSDNRRAFMRLEAAALRCRVEKWVVVGGSPSVREELRAGAPARWQLRLIDGTARRTSREAQSDLDWADRVLIWGGSELDHKVSNLYTLAARQKGKLIHIGRRGLSALLQSAADHLER